MAQRVPDTEWTFDIPVYDAVSYVQSGDTGFESESKPRQLSDASPLDLSLYSGPLLGAESLSQAAELYGDASAPSSAPSQHITLPARKYRLSRSPLDSLQVEFRKYSKSDSLDSLELLRTSDAETRGITPDALDWSYVQRRFELTDLSPSNECPSLATSSTISSRNSSTRSAKSFKWDGVEQPESGACPLPECGRMMSDLAAHMLSHQAERPEKCPVEACDYSWKGFARAYDKVRHTTTHFKGRVVCGFCSDSDMSSDKSFDRCDVYLRHLVFVHGAEQAPSSKNVHLHRNNAIKQRRQLQRNQPVATCTLCAEPFDVQGFYEHFRGCVLRQVTRGCTPSQPDQTQRRPPSLQHVFESKESPRNDSVVTPVDDISIVAQSYPQNPASVAGPSPHLPVSEPQLNTDVQDQDGESKEIDELTASSRCLSLTSTGDEAAKSSDEETDWSDDVGSPESAPDADGLQPMLSPVKQELVNRIMLEFHRIFDAMLRTHGGGSGSSSNIGHGYYSGSSGSSTYSTSSFISRKRSLSGGSPPPNDNGDDHHKRRRPDPKLTGGKQPIPEMRFACPYYKRNPGRHQTFTSCRDPGFITVARLKEHLYRRHLLPIQCNRCCSTFPNEPTLREHQRDARGCKIKEQIPLEGFDKDQERKLKSKKRSLVYQSEEDKWKGVYRILFPDDTETDMPSPYIEYQPCNAGQSGESTNVARFQEFSRLELPRLVRRTLEVAVEEEAQPLEDKLKERLVDIVKTCQTQLIGLFQQSTTTPEADAVAIASALASDAVPVQQELNIPIEPAFQDFDSFAVTASDFIPIPSNPYHECIQSHPEPSISDSPDSGYDSTWPNTGIQQETTLPTELPTFDRAMVFRDQLVYVPAPDSGETEYADLGGYYGLFEDRGLGSMDPTWAYLDPAGAHGMR